MQSAIGHSRLSQPLPAPIPQRDLKVGYFTLEALNAFATTFFFNYLFFFMHSRFAFGDADNLTLSALNGFVYMLAAWLGGRFAQRYGYYFSVELGFGFMAVALLAGSVLSHAVGYYPVIVGWSLGLCLTWPALEALVSEGESRSGLQWMVGAYNVVWAAGSALAYFTGGALLRVLGTQALFWLPIGIHLLQLGLVEWLKRKPASTIMPGAHFLPNDLPEAPSLKPAPVGNPKAFLRMAWIANPFAYMAINTVIALMPNVAVNLELSLSMAGVVCSVWFLARLVAFAVLWRWPGWHYRFRWLITAYALMIACFLLMLLVQHVWVVVLAQIVFGLCVGLLYYSSLYYSMDVGETKGEHGGIHESALGGGIFFGPAVGATALYFFPHAAKLGPSVISVLLFVGGIAMATIKIRSRRPPS
jgi:MFS family permease